jgi:DNA invertase Pin-like site-specific DNA recombinase
MRYGYARVSSKTQDHARQIEALRAAGCERIFEEKVSGKSATDRLQFQELMRTLAPGDVVVVCKLDRLARSSRDLQNILHDLGELDCGFVSLGDAWCDTTTSTGRLLVAIMGGIAEFERDLIRQRCSEGLERAKAKGVRLGRRPKLTPHQRQEAIARRTAGESVTEIARSYNVDHSMISRL